MIIFTVQSKLDKNVRLTKTQWDHITFRHSELIGQSEKVLEVLQEPDIVLYSEMEDNYQHYKYYFKTSIGPKYLLVIVMHLNGDGFFDYRIFS